MCKHIVTCQTEGRAPAFGLTRTFDFVRGAAHVVTRIEKPPFPNPLTFPTAVDLFDVPRGGAREPEVQSLPMQGDLEGLFLFHVTTCAAPRTQSKVRVSPKAGARPLV